ncbi:VIT domain-containing protein [Polyangium aurulentum]|uniref:VIT domain-containing protein n=1 Tax=Polyangium aurulentum TaxID=2567896 RepID=UPI0010AEB7E7|nr:VIT domain-containing protein [Polyangium aurulentum]UQA61889.1 hypothetical protein E8A73_016015 [Polyangium aurulentum]
MRRAPALLLLLALGQAAASCGSGPTSALAPSTGEGGGDEAALAVAGSPLPVVPIRWEAQPVAADDSVASRAAGAPMSLTSAEGVGLSLIALEASAVVEDPLAFTELRFVFKNPEPRAIEGRFEIALPPGATISRFAMKNADGWQEGEVVELQAARVAYEDFLHRRSDPALLEKAAGNRFGARVFPIPASGEKEIIVSYSQELASGDDPYRLYLRGLPRLGRFDLRVIEGHRGPKGAEGRRAFTFAQRDFVPDRDFVLPLGAPGKEPRGLRHENMALARVTPVAEDRPDSVKDLLVLLDTSASRALDLRAQVERLADLVEGLRASAGPDMPLAVACFDQELEPIYVGPAGKFGRAEMDAILRRGALGASDLGLALESAAAFARKQGGRFSRALLLTDGIATAGPAEASELLADLKELQGAGIGRLDAIVAGGIRDEALLRKLTVGAFPRDGVVLDAAASPSVLAGRLGRATVNGISVRVPGARWMWPEKLAGVQPGDEVLVYADLPPETPFEVELSGGARRAVRTEFAERPLIERAAVKAQIERLSSLRDAATDEKKRKVIEEQIVSLSTKHRVLSDFTALLVLETDADYARFGIDRRALADILVVGRSGIERLHRSAPQQMVVAAAPASPAAQKSETESQNKGSEKKEDSGRAPAAAPGAPDGEPPPPPSAEAPLSKDALAEEAKPAPAPEAPPPMQDAPSKEASMEMEDIAGEVQGGAAGGVVGGAVAPSAPAAASKPAAPSAAAPPPPPPPPPPRSRPAPPPSRPAIRTNPWRNDPDERPRSSDRSDEDENEEPTDSGNPPYTGKLAEVMALIAKKRPADALAIALAWRAADAGDVLALVALGEAYEALGKKDDAARAYGSIIDLFPSRADMRRFAGARLERLGAGPAGWLPLAIDTYRKAAASRPDHPGSHRLLAFALARAGKFEAAFDAIFAGLLRPYASDRFAGVRRILVEDAGILGAALIRARPDKRAEVERRLGEVGLKVATKPSLRFVLNWETDANDVDFHIRDARRGHAYFNRPVLKSGGELFADVTTGYGPECFAIPGRAAAYPYRLQAHYYAKGPMGYGMGKLEVLEHDGRGGLKFDERPFVVMTDQAFVDLGTVNGPLKGF